MVRAAKKQIKKKEKYQSVNSDSENDHYADDFDAKNPFGGDEIEDFNSKQEKILIDKMNRKSKKSFDYSSDEDEVLAFDDDSDDDDDDKYDEDKYELEEEDDEDNEVQNEDEDNLISTSWGRKKSAYYSGNKIQNEEDAELEEEEARLLQSKMMKQLDTNDFGLDAFKLKGDKVLKTSEEIESKKLAEKALGDIEQDEIDQDLKTISKNLSKLSKKEKLDFLKQESPELFELVRDFKQKMNELDQKLLPIYKAIKVGSIPNSLACDYIINKTKLYLMYASHLSFYFALKSQRLPVDNHPIVKNILQFRNLCKQINSIDDTLNEEVDFLLRAIQNGNQIVKKLATDKKAKKSVKFVEAKEKERNRVVFDDELESASEEIQMDENANQELNVDKRAINYEMMKNKGLTPKRDKMYRNPRVRNRIKSRKALIKHKSIVPKVRSQDKRYGGEATGIRTNIVRAVKIK